MFVDPAQLDLIERRIIRHGGVMAIELGREIKVGFAGNHNVYFAVLRRDGQLIRRIEGRLRRDERPGADAGVCGAELGGGKQGEQREFVQSSSGKACVLTTIVPTSRKREPDRTLRTGNDFE